jgi:hypothetical protein
MGHGREWWSDYKWSARNHIASREDVIRDSSKSPLLRTILPWRC